MAPMWWSILMNKFLISMMLMMTMNFFIENYTKKLNMMNWKW